MKRTSSLIIALMIFSICAAMSISEEDPAVAPSAADIIAQARKKILSLKSYSCNLKCRNKGDEKVKERHQNALKDYESILKKIELVTRKDMGSEPKDMYESISAQEYVAPFHLQVSLDKDDYLPEFIQGARTYYDPSENDLEVFLKEPMVGLVFRNPVAEADSGIVMVINWKFNLLEYDCSIANGAVPEYVGTDEYDGRPMYVVQMAMKNDKKPWRMPCGGDTYDIPENAWPQLDRELANTSWRIDNHGEGLLKVWIDQETMLPLKKEIHFGGDLFVEHYVTDIVLNKVNEKKMLKAKKPKKGLL